MERQFRIHQSARASERWLMRLVAAMEEAARPEIRAWPCEASILAKFRVQLSLPAPSCAYRVTAFSLRN